MDTVDRKRQYVSVGILGVCFMLMFTAYNSIQNMISPIYAQMGYRSLGQIAVFCIYGSFGFANFIAAYVIQRSSYRKLMFFCSLGYSLFNMTGLYVTACQGHREGICSQGLIYSTVIFFSLVTGVCASLIWVAQAAYVSDLSTATTKGELFGLFWGLMMASQIIGNILSTFILGKISNMVYFFVLAIVGLTGACMLLLVRPTGKESYGQKQPQSLKQRMDQMKQLIFESGTLPLKLYYTFAGVTVACYAGFVYKLVDRAYKKHESQSQEQYQKQLKFHTGLVFIALGVSQVLTGLIMNRVGDKFNRYRMASFGAVIVEMAVIMTLLTYFLQSYPLCFVVIMLWGGSEAYLQANTGALISSEYEGKVAAFSVFRMFFAIGVTGVMAINIIFTETGVPDWVFIILVAVYQMIVTVASEQLEGRSMARKKLSTLTEEIDA